MARNKILYIHETSRFSGGENSLLNLALNLDKEAFEPVFACPPGGPFVEILLKSGIKVYPVGFPAVRKLTGVLGAVVRVRKIIRDEHISLVHSNSIRTHMYAWLAGRAEKVPVIWHERNLIEREIIDPDRALSFLPDAIICNSRAIAERFINKGSLPEKVRVIHNGVDIQKFSPAASGNNMRKAFGIGSDEIVIGIASRFNKGKGHEIFLASAARLLKDVPDGRRKLRFLIAGGAVFEEDKDREKYVKSLAGEYGISDRVIFTGIIKDMPDIYAAIDIFVLASLAEPCGRVVSEAMACGKPVIGTDSGGTPEMITDGVTGLLVMPGNADAIADALAILIGDKDKRLEMGRSSRQKAEKDFDISLHAKETGQLYLDMIDKAKR